jgi:hypothetical protein
MKSLLSSSFMKSICYRLYPDARIRVTSSSLSSSISSNNEKLVVLLGWGGSVPRNLKKIEDFYESRDVKTVSFIMPLGCFKFVRDYLIDDLIHTINNNSKNSSIYVHSYSNNGLWAYGELSQRLNELNGNIVKLVIDSAPHFIYEPVSIHVEATLLSKVVTSIVSKGSYYHPIYTPVIYTSLVIMSSCSRLITEVCRLLNIPNIFIPDLIQLSKYLRDKTPIIDTLFIYSSGDALISTNTIKTFTNKWKERKVPLQSVEFGDDVPHTSSFYKHTDQYKTLICNYFKI